MDAPSRPCWHHVATSPDGGGLAWAPGTCIPDLPQLDGVHLLAQAVVIAGADLDPDASACDRPIDQPQSP